MRTPRVLIAAVAVLMTAVGVTACTGDAAVDKNGVTTLRYQGWPGQVTLPEVAEHLGFFNGKIKLDWVGNTISGPQDIQSAATGQTDFGGAFAGAVAKLITSGAPITSVINYYGTDQQTIAGFYVRDDSPITKPTDLVGKKIGVNTLGGQLEADIHDQLKKDGLSQEQIKTVQLVALPAPNTEDALRKGQIDAAGLSGQFQQRAVINGGLRAVFTDLSLYGPFNGGPYVFRNDLIKKNPDGVRAFTAGVAKAIEWERTTPREKVLATFTDIVTQRKRPNDDTSSLKYWLSVGVPSKGGLLSDSDFTRWQSWLQDTGSVKGDLDASKFYTNEFNPYADKGAESDAKAG
ncbi:ABC transporter substrate-binding protein [Williamsia maris]|uniref:ABC-type nitrate/sulfonate/bicarbonate transport system, substrate-binding protein n=1 Tax=Williamsia maris TaxID=72806 RepID=A0ABT1HE12_9NOCA|nr:ABC transporter substrate-binding protein [Williamsia maris]MCP2176489.1 ABC-type nitrate/sulfonate/bicarbonate transport system, substrate-binding protein [Williamsia maris]